MNPSQSTARSHPIEEVLLTRELAPRWLVVAQVVVFGIAAIMVCRRRNARLAWEATASRTPSSVPSQLFTLPGAPSRNSAVNDWMRDHSGPLGAIAKHWFEVIPGCGSDVRELMHDG